MDGRISTQQFYQNQFELMGKNQQRISKLQLQLATNEKYQSPDENPVATYQIRSLSYSMDQLATYQNNTTTLTNRNTLIESSANALVNNLQQAAEVITQAQNGTLNNANRQSLAQQLQGILNNMINTANTQDTDGSYIFSGFKGNIPPYVNSGGIITYQGDQGTSTLQINASTNITYADSGFRVLENIKTGNGTFVASQGTIPNTGTGVISPGVLVDPSQYVPDTYTIDFVTNGSGQLALTVTGATTGQIVPALPATIPANAPAYIPGQGVIANGMQFAITGQPNVGDQFQIKPSQSQSVFATLGQLISTLQQTPSNPTQLADQQNLVGQAAASIQQAFIHVTGYASEIGTRLASLSQASAFNTSMQTQLETMKSNLGDADTTQVILQLNQQTLALQLAQQAFLKVQDLSLMNFLR